MCGNKKDNSFKALKTADSYPKKYKCNDFRTPSNIKELLILKKNPNFNDFSEAKHLQGQ